MTRAGRSEGMGVGGRAPIPSLSEYDLPPISAPLFLVGEVWAALHARELKLAELEREAVSVNPLAVAEISARARLQPGLRVDPASMAVDIVAALGVYSPQDAAAILAGYVRGGYELLDVKWPGLTDAMLDHLRVSEPRPRPQPSPLDVPALMRSLGCELHVDEQKRIVASTVPPRGPNAWRTAPADAFHLILGLLVAGVDCRALFERDRAWWRFGAHSPVYRVLWPDSRTSGSATADVEQLLPLSRGMELAVGLGRVLRNSRLSEPFDFGQVLFWARKVLVEGPEEQAMRLGDILIDLSWRCAHLAAEASGEAVVFEAQAQKSIILLEYTARGQRSDEARLQTLTRSLHLRDWPSILEPPPSVSNLGMLNSLLLTYRELATKSAAIQRQGGGAGVLRSAAIRGLWLARRMLRLAFEAAASRHADTAASAFPLLRLTIKNYANLAATLVKTAALEQQTTGASAWLHVMGDTPNVASVASELNWILGFFEAAAQEGFSLEVARHFMRGGEPYRHASSVVTPRPSGSPEPSN